MIDGAKTLLRVAWAWADAAEKSTAANVTQANNATCLGDEVFILWSPFDPAMPADCSTWSISALSRITDPNRDSISLD
jgi:hypothetical protein